MVSNLKNLLCMCNITGSDIRGSDISQMRPKPENKNLSQVPLQIWFSTVAEVLLAFLPIVSQQWSRSSLIKFSLALQYPAVHEMQQSVAVTKATSCSDGWS